ncbi:MULTISPECIES: precorrin-3B C(17)-methyltransferase [Streptomyces]|uniref:Precorrin-3B C(17)-methyltransferase n=1 Tax=Streptomyces thermoviolaceus subsp. thermoviolaceus TaxID=66860 RepID=A0ABX0YT90_STRTL|nr:MULTISPECIES: precorrin-3B C(17)-methyltransferase [Streptomyces]WTD49748.1 precorrin-3B C(17)-methyltransferase [Streptomyces thermoviolaceus]NJP14374.1 precorrin-3B C(17)-methyltransferase [Streptomyces thermoviolaceus subsp. thermoviolaceus]RSR96962.1 precorrin-3B C(17)-methyltransferase [Streptomyces sp. WAC00469]GGV81370.1 precorrin-3B C(17)-methyltransferase [Streptomyces thermoviolaceus subsp. apingens]GHA78143.1 precorrin-3B C(17)-methyltransferase [Streptomyces thermoviolaceus subs
MIGLISATAAGAAARDRVAAAWPDRTRVYDGPVGEAVRAAFAECTQLVCFLATGATVRLLAPLLGDKRADPGVVCVDEAGRFAVALTGGHAGGANALAREIGELLGAQPVVTTATDAVGMAGLDTLGLPVEGDVAGVSRALLDGESVALAAEVVWPLPPLPVAAPGTAAAYTVRVTDRAVIPGEGEVVLRPPTLVVGVGASRGVPAEEVRGLVEQALGEAGLSARSVAALATVDAKADEPGVVAAAEQLGVPLLTYPAQQLAAVPVPHPSRAPLDAVGTPSVAEAAALAGGGDLLVPKRKSRRADGRPSMATCAVVRRPPRGRLAVIGLGPGARDLLTPRAKAELRRASVLVGLDQYVDRIRDLLRPGTRVLESGLGAEEERARTAVAEARRGHAVALIGSGDAGVYAMASPALAEAGDDIDVVGVPGVTAALAAGAILGAPLGHDHVSISLSDLHTPWEVIERRVRAAAEADLVVTFYNPRSRGRDWQLPKALALLAEHRSPTTPVGVVRNASRPGESSRITTLAELDPATVDMMTVVTVGNTATRTIAGRMVTPRGYRWQDTRPEEAEWTA